MFEPMAHCEGWPEEGWAQSLAPLITAEAQLAYCTLVPALVEDYLVLREEILAQCSFSSCMLLVEFLHWSYQPYTSNQMDTLLLTTKCWFQPEQHTTTQVTEKVTLDWFLHSLPQPLE